MMKKGLIDGLCPKCESSILQKEEGVLRGELGRFSQKGYKVSMFICRKCNYMEFYYIGKTFWK